MKIIFQKNKSIKYDIAVISGPTPGTKETTPNTAKTTVLITYFSKSTPLRISFINFIPCLIATHEAKAGLNLMAISIKMSKSVITFFIAKA